MSNHPSDHAQAGQRTKAAGSINAYMVKGRTQTQVANRDPHEGVVGYTRKVVEQYVVDRTGEEAKKQFKLMYPGSTNIRVRFIKAIA